MKKAFALLVATAVMLSGCSFAPTPNQHQEANSVASYHFPAEDQTHEGTWLTWPHSFTYGESYQKEIEGIWVSMVQALHDGERVHVIAYDATEQQRIAKLLEQANVNMQQIDFVIAKTDDVWTRDTGPMFAYDNDGQLVIVDFGFDGWGGKVPSNNDDALPQAVASAKDLPIVSVSDFVLEGGSVELDGAGTLMATKSSVLSKNRNTRLELEQVEDYLQNYLGAQNIIWLEGAVDEDITDAHIDGIARFFDSKSLLTVSQDDFFELYESIPESDYDALLTAKNANGEPYNIIKLPLTKHNVKGLDYKGSYLNYYVGNNVVLVPVYDDPHDTVAVEKLTQLYTGKNIVPINVNALYRYGGMLHCVTQQQPL